MSETIPSNSTATIHQLMGRVMSDVGGVRKGGWNEAQKFHFRALEDVMNACHEALTEHGVFFLPEVQERVTEKRVTSGGKDQHVVSLRIRYTFYGPRGDSVACEMWGEGADSGDKATSKAESAALKYALMQALCIPTLDAADADAESPEETTSVQASSSSGFTGNVLSPDPQTNPILLRKEIRRLDPQGNHWGRVDLHQCTVDQLQEILRAVKGEAVSA